VPFSIALPAPDITWVTEYFGPLAGGSGVFQGLDGNGVAGPLSNTAAFNYVGARPAQGREAWLQAGNGVNSEKLQGWAAVGTGVITRWKYYRGRTCMNDRSVGAFNSDFVVPGDWCPDLRGSPLAVPTGALQDDASIVAVFDFHVAAALPGAPPWLDDLVGWYFLPVAIGLDTRQVPGGFPLAGVPSVGGFGIFLNNSGVGTTVLEYVSWATGAPGAILERVRVPLAVLPDIQKWSSVRLVIIGARPGFGAALSLQVNRQDVIGARSFGTAQLNEPTTSIAGAMGMGVGFNSAAGADIYSQFHMKFGRFTPGGAELQAP